MLIELLNRADLNQDLKKELLLKSEDALEDITTITEAETLKIVIEHGKAKGNWKNIIYFTGIFDDNEIDYNLSTLLFVNEYIWEEFIDDTKLCITEIENDAYQAILNQVLEGNTIPKDKIQELLVLLETQIIIKNPIEVSMEFYKILIAQKLLSWRTSVYKIIYDGIGSGGNNIIIDYYLNEIDSSEEELSHLIAADKFLWDKRLFKHIRDTDIDLTNKYVISIFKTISHEEKIEVIQSDVMPLTEELLSYLQTEDDELFYQYLISWINNTDWENNDLSQFISSHDFNWNLNVYNTIAEIDSNVALLYLTTFEDDLPSKLKDVSISQETFSRLLDTDITLKSKLESLNHFSVLGIEINSDIINWLLKVDDKEKIYAILKRTIVENEYLLKLKNNNNIAKVFADCISYYDYDKQTIYRLLENIKEPYGRLINPGKQVRFIDNEYNKTFLEALKNTGFITEPKFSNNKIIIYNKRKFDFS